MILIRKTIGENGIFLHCIQNYTAFDECDVCKVEHVHEFLCE